MFWTVTMKAFKMFQWYFIFFLQGSFPRSGFTFKVYYPSNRTVEDRWVSLLSGCDKDEWREWFWNEIICAFVLTANFKDCRDNNALLTRNIVIKFVYCQCKNWWATKTVALFHIWCFISCCLFMCIIKWCVLTEFIDILISSSQHHPLLQSFFTYTVIKNCIISYNICFKIKQIFSQLSVDIERWIWEPNKTCVGGHSLFMACESQTNYCYLSTFVGFSTTWPAHICLSKLNWSIKQSFTARCAAQFNKYMLSSVSGEAEPGWTFSVDIFFTQFFYIECTLPVKS